MKPFLLFFLLVNPFFLSTDSTTDCATISEENSEMSTVEKTGATNNTTCSSTTQSEEICKEEPTKSEEAIANWMPDVNLQKAVANQLGISIEQLSKEQMKQLTKVSFVNKQITSIQGLEYAENLCELNLQNNQIKDLSPLSQLHQLTNLNLHDNHIANADALKTCTTLNSLDLSTNQLTDTTFLINMNQLQTLSLNENQLTTLAGVQQLTALTTLNATANKIKDIQSLTGLVALEDLRLGENQITDIQPLQSLTRLTRLYLYQNQIQNIESLTSLTELKILHLGTNQIKKVEALSSLTQLTDLKIYENQLTSLIPLQTLTNLKTLWVYKNQLQTLEGIEQMKQLTQLSGYENQLTNIEALTSLIQLKQLALQKNQLIDLTALTSLTQLTTLNLAYNQITEISALTDLHSLTELNIANNCLTDIRPLSHLSKLSKLAVNNQSISLNKQVVFGNSFTQAAKVLDINGCVVPVSPWSSESTGTYEDGTITWTELPVPSEGMLPSYWEIKISIGTAMTSFSGEFQQAFETKKDQSKVEAHDSSIPLNSQWEAKDNFDCALDEEGNSLSYDKITITGKVDTSKAGDYPITYTYKKATKTITVTVLDGAPDWYVRVPATLQLSDSTNTQTTIQLVDAQDQTTAYSGNKNVVATIQSDQGFHVKSKEEQSLRYDYFPETGEAIPHDNVPHPLGTMNQTHSELQAILHLVDTTNQTNEFKDTLHYTFKEITP